MKIYGTVFLCIPLLACGDKSSIPGDFKWNLLNGTWAESSNNDFACRSDKVQQQFEVSKDGRRLTFISDRELETFTGQKVKRYSAEIIESKPYSLFISYGEEVTGLSDEFRNWEMRFIGPNTYRWRPVSWPADEFNVVIGVKCSD